MLRVFEAFAGIGAWKKALERLNVEHEVVGFSENDPYPAKAYCIIHNESENKNIGDITKADNTYKDLDLFCWSPPCQSWSVAGRQEGFEDPRGVLFFDALRLIRNSKPKYCVMENVKGLAQKKFQNEFKAMLEALDDEGYNNYWKILNARNYNIPQNRERLFIVSIRKDIDDGSFKFPEPMPLEIKLIDVLQAIPDEKYYISKQMEEYIENKKNKDHNFRVEISDPNGIKESPLRAQGDKPMVYDPKYELSDKELAYMDRKTRDGRTHWDFEHHHDSGEETSSCVVANTYKGVPYNVLVDRRDAKGCSLRTRTYAGQSQQLEIRKDDVSNAVTTVTKDSMIIENSNYRIRKLTPLETMRLMDFDDEDFYKLKEAKISDTRIYKFSGNSICVGVIEGIFKNLLK